MKTFYAFIDILATVGTYGFGEYMPRTKKISNRHYVLVLPDLNWASIFDNATNKYTEVKK